MSPMCLFLLFFVLSTNAEPYQFGAHPFVIGYSFQPNNPYQLPYPLAAAYPTTAGATAGGYQTFFPYQSQPQPSEVKYDNNNENENPKVARTLFDSNNNQYNQYNIYQIGPDPAREHENAANPSPVNLYSSGHNEQFSFSSSAEIKYRIGVISDLDKEAKDEETDIWKSYLKEGYLSISHNSAHPSSPNVSIVWDEDKVHTIKSGLAYSSRGMELSTLNAFNGKLYSCDDKTGVVYELPMNSETLELTPIPWAILADGNFTGPNGFKCEWATIKDGDLWIGGHGKHSYNKDGEIVDSNERFIKKISPTGEIVHLDWSENFDRMAKALGVQMPGYVIHEAAGWSDLLQKWIFMPRKVSKEKFEPEHDLTTGNNMILITDENFNEITVVPIGAQSPMAGFSGFKFIPGTNDQYIVALKTTTKEDKDDLKSFIMAFDLRGNVLLEETEISDQKFEGIEFLSFLK